ncbi:MAG: class I SAM-dependent methyltransferase [Candidatus Thorarchaeota archaeon]
MKSYIVLPLTCKSELPDKFKADDMRFPERLVEVFLEEYTTPGDKVIDIFAGLGTTLVVAEQMNRIGYGVEIDPHRFGYTQSQIKNKGNIIHGDARLIDQYDLPKMDFALCSPIYMNKSWTRSPLTADQTPGTYFGYLDDLRDIFAKLKSIVKVGGHIVVEAANLKSTDVTTFAWDVCRSLSRELLFEREVVICWEDADSSRGVNEYGYDHSYCLVFRNSF